MEKTAGKRPTNILLYAIVTIATFQNMVNLSVYNKFCKAWKSGKIL